MFNPADIHKLNSEIENWENKNHSDLLSEMDALNIQHSKHSPNKIPLRKALRSRLRHRHDLIDRISYTMPRSAIFLHKGVSRGHGKNNPRKAEPWYEPVVNKNLDSLTEIVAEGQGNLVVNALNIR